MALRLHVDAAEAVHPEGVLDAVDVLGRGEQPDHVRAAEDQRLAVAPALHARDSTSGSRSTSSASAARSTSSWTGRTAPAGRARVPAAGRRRSGVAGLVPVAGRRELVQAPGDLGGLGRSPARNVVERGAPRPRSRPPAAQPLRLPERGPRTRPPAGASRPPRPAIVESEAHGGSCAPIDRERSAARIERDIETLAGPRVHDHRRGDPPLRVHARVPPHARLLHAASCESLGFDVSRGPGRHARRAQPARRASAVFGIGSHCDSNRNGGTLRRHDGRRHGARGVPARTPSTGSTCRCS